MQASPPAKKQRRFERCTSPSKFANTPSGITWKEQLEPEDRQWHAHLIHQGVELACGKAPKKMDARDEAFAAYIAGGTNAVDGPSSASPATPTNA
ncbi:hypothetical protein JCM10213_004881 [Rhodosporidiobolus nylandii]